MASSYGVDVGKFRMHQAIGRQRNAKILCGFVADRPFPEWIIFGDGETTVNQVESVYCDFIKLPTDSGKSYVIDGSLKM